MKLESVTLVLENCDSITINSKYINDFCVEDIKHSIFKFCSGDVKKMKTANHFALSINKEANVKRCAFGIEDLRLEDESVFDRLIEYDDITQIEFDLVKDCEKDNNERHVYRLNWIGDDNSNNAAQKSLLDEHGNLYILVDKERDIEDCFPYVKLI